MFYSSFTDILNVKMHFSLQLFSILKISEIRDRRMSFLKEMFAFVSDQIKLFHNLSFKMLKFIFRQIKMSSPNLNNLIIVGCLLCYSGVIILGLDSSLTSEPAFRYICTVKAWVLMAGFTLSFGSMFSKTWRVHSIFTNVQLNKKVRKKINGIVLLFFLWSQAPKMFQQDETWEFLFCVGTFLSLDLYEENVHVLTKIIFLAHICVEKLFKPIWESLEVLSSLKKYFVW